ncbi:hypothetical protein B296_00039601 [Ensete ventricosum]|uniref:Uncharacterized protein n=1 Tax=Ensete ventricosum TaxID=4639 RepID=A0A426ZBZ1_ENSVE|nr:hypothetical protein B296_00039601 [Ensete ventricosum]
MVTDGFFGSDVGDVFYRLLLHGSLRLTLLKTWTVVSDYLCNKAQDEEEPRKAFTGMRDRFKKEVKELTSQICGAKLMLRDGLWVKECCDPIPAPTLRLLCLAVEVFDWEKYSKQSV